MREAFLYGKLAAEDLPEWCRELADLTKRIMEEHYASNQDFVIGCLAPQVTWIGAMERQFMIGAEQIRAELVKEKGIVRKVEASEYHHVYADKHCCTVAGWLKVSTPESTGMLLAATQRVTFQYALFDSGPKVVHIHASNSWDVLESDEIFPFRAGRETYEYVQQILRQKKEAPPRIAINGLRGKTHLLTIDEIVMAEARGGRSILHCINEQISTNTKLAVVISKLPEQFLQVHRSFAININYVVGIRRCALHLCDGYVVPVPEKRYTQIKKEVLKRAASIYM